MLLRFNPQRRSSTTQNNEPLTYQWTDIKTPYHLAHGAMVPPFKYTSLLVQAINSQHIAAGQLELRIKRFKIASSKQVLEVDCALGHACFSPKCHIIETFGC